MNYLYASFRNNIYIYKYPRMRSYKKIIQMHIFIQIILNINKN